MPTNSRQPTPRIAIVGVGPRGLTVFERLCANRASMNRTQHLTVVLIDATCVGTGTVWRRNQPGHLLMNTVASQVTVFTDASVEMEGPVVPGPSLYEWASYVSKIAPLGDLSDQILAEARDMTPDSYPSRSFYGHYLRWAYQHLATRHGATVNVIEITATVTDLAEDDDGLQRLELDDGSTIDRLDAVVLTQGHLGLQSEPDSEIATFTAFAARHDLHYIPPGNAADTDLAGIPAGRPAIVRGLGLTFFDYMTLLTVGRGGSFETKNGQLTYVPSGREPILHAGSRRGIPYHARGANQKGIDGRHAPFLLTPDRVMDFRHRADELDFAADIWPLVAREVEIVYYCVLIANRVSPNEVRRFRSLFAATDRGSDDECDVLNMFNIEGHLRWDWDRILDPARGLRFRTPASFHQWLITYLQQDVRHAKQGNVHGAVKAALDVLRDLRNEVRLIVDHGGIRGSSYRDHLDRWFTPTNAFLSIGPPAHKIEQLSALVRAGTVHVTGPQTSITADPSRGTFRAHSPAVPGADVEASVLIDARLPEPDLRRTTDSLLRGLVTTGYARPYVLPDPHEQPYETGGLDVEQATHRVIDSGGRPHPRRFALGVPTEAVHWVTAAGPRPGVNSVSLADADSVARTVLTLTDAPRTTPYKV